MISEKNQSTHKADGYQGLENSSKAVDTRQEIATAAKVSTDTVLKSEVYRMKMSEERKEYLKAYKTTVKRIPLEVSYPFYILLMEHMWKYGDTKHTNSYIKSRLQFVMDMEDAGIMDRVKTEIEARKRTGAFKKN